MTTEYGGPLPPDTKQTMRDLYGPLSQGPKPTTVRGMARDLLRVLDALAAGEAHITELEAEREKFLSDLVAYDARSEQRHVALKARITEGFAQVRDVAIEIIDGLRARVADARELVLATEWGSSGDSFCPGCGGWADRGGHKASCALAAFLAKTAPCPTVEEMVGIAPDITGGLSSEEHVRRLRDD